MESHLSGMLGNIYFPSHNKHNKHFDFPGGLVDPLPSHPDNPASTTSVDNGSKIGEEFASQDIATVESQLIKARLATIFSEYPTVDAGTPELVFQPGFIPFVHKWKDLILVREKEDDLATKDHLNVLIDALEPEIKESFTILDHFEATGYVSFQQLDLVFSPGETIIHISDGVMSAGVLRELSFESIMRQYHFLAEVIEWNGDHFGVQEVTWTINEYKGDRQLLKLNAFPLRIHDDAESIRESLIKRGRQFENFQAPVEKPLPIHGRIVIDAEAYFSLQGDCAPRLGDLKQLRSVDEPHPSESEADKDHDIDSSSRGVHDPTPLTDLQCLIAVARVRGFAFEEKIWCQFYVTEIQEITWTEDALEKLVLGENEKNLLLAMIQPPESRKLQHFDDFIPGKGRGVIMLLCGPPGVGKTLTAESVAERLKRPLYRVGTADLGTTVASVEHRLKEVLDRCSHWNAVLLIDEAEVFLEARSSNNIERNELVSTFLRLLEYYSGVMFLTTNRVAAIDPAFESRIDIAFAYQDLDREGRAQVWRNFISGLGSDVDVGDDDLQQLAQIELNGRHIKSAIKTACILAAKDQVPLNVKHLRVVLAVRREAAKLLNGGFRD